MLISDFQPPDPWYNPFYGVSSTVHWLCYGSSSRLICLSSWCIKYIVHGATEWPWDPSSHFRVVFGTMYSALKPGRRSPKICHLGLHCYLLSVQAVSWGTSWSLGISQNRIRTSKNKQQGLPFPNQGADVYGGCYLSIKALFEGNGIGLYSETLYMSVDLSFQITILTGRK